jgi:hypothetical protein
MRYLSVTTVDDRVAPPYGIICRQFQRGGVVPFLGAGASLTVHGDDERFDGDDPKFLPRADELSDWLAEECEFPPNEQHDLAKVASYFQVRATREELVDYLRQVFSRDYPIGAIHRFLAEVPKPMLIVTTNYDELLERAFEEAGKPYHLVMYPDSDELAGAVLWWKPGAAEPERHAPSLLPLNVDEATVIYKMHGSIRRAEEERKWDSFVITEEDYVRFLSRMTAKGGAIPSRFMLHIRNSSLLFLGYGLRDWNLRVMLEKLRRTFGRDDAVSLPSDEGDAEALLAAQQGTKRSWAVQWRPSQLERILWDSRNVQIFDQDLSVFADALRKKMKS